MEKSRFIIHKIYIISITFAVFVRHFANWKMPIANIPSHSNSPAIQLFYQVHGNGPIKLLFIMGLGADHLYWISLVFNARCWEYQEKYWQWLDLNDWSLWLCCVGWKWNESWRRDWTTLQGWWERHAVERKEKTDKKEKRIWHACWKSASDLKRTGVWRV